MNYPMKNGQIDPEFVDKVQNRIWEDREITIPRKYIICSIRAAQQVVQESEKINVGGFCSMAGMEKARLTREQAELLEKFKEEYVTEEEILENKFQNFVHDRDDHALKHIPVRTLAIALYVGYEIIEEDQVVVVKEEMRNTISSYYASDGGNEMIGEAYKEGVQMVLSKLNIFIKGINLS